MISYDECQQHLGHLLRKGAQLHTDDGSYYLAWANMQQADEEPRLTLLYRHPEEPLSRSVCLYVTTYDLDKATDKLYFAYSDTDYVQCRPLPADQLLTTVTLFQQEYLFLTNEVIPERAKRDQWPIWENHCLQRILLDHLFGDAWHRHLPQGQTPAYRQLHLQQLGLLLYRTHQLLWSSMDEVDRLNQQSLTWRQKKA